MLDAVFENEWGRGNVRSALATPRLRVTALRLAARLAWIASTTRSATGSRPPGARSRAMTSALGSAIHVRAESAECERAQWPTTRRPRLRDQLVDIRSYGCSPPSSRTPPGGILRGRRPAEYPEYPEYPDRIQVDPRDGSTRESRASRSRSARRTVRTVRATTVRSKPKQAPVRLRGSRVQTDGTRARRGVLKPSTRTRRTPLGGAIGRRPRARFDRGRRRERGGPARRRRRACVRESRRGEASTAFAAARCPSRRPPRTRSSFLFDDSVWARRCDGGERPRTRLWGSWARVSGRTRRTPTDPPI